MNATRLLLQERGMMNVSTGSKKPTNLFLFPVSEHVVLMGRTSPLWTALTATELLLLV
jgi:hypothetical protein